MPPPPEPGDVSETTPSILSLSFTRWIVPCPSPYKRIAKRDLMRASKPASAPALAYGPLVDRDPSAPSIEAPMAPTVPSGQPKEDTVTPYQAVKSPWTQGMTATAS